jgi:hypothetical protein
MSVMSGSQVTIVCLLLNFLFIGSIWRQFEYLDQFGSSTMFLAHVDDVCFADLKKSQYDLPESEQSVYWHVIVMSLCICIPILWVKLRRSHRSIEAYGCMWHGRIMIGGKVVHSDVPVFARHKNVSRITRPAAWGKVASVASYSIMWRQLDAYTVYTPHACQSLTMCIIDPYSLLHIQSPYHKHAIRSSCGNEAASGVKAREEGRRRERDLDGSRVGNSIGI